MAAYAYTSEVSETKDTQEIFQTNEKKGVEAFPHLDSDTSLLEGLDDLRGQFKRLMSSMTDEILNLLEDLSKTGDLNEKCTASRTRQIIKLHKNLQHILTLLRYWEAKDQIIAHLERQRDHKRDLIQALTSCIIPQPLEGQ